MTSVYPNFPSHVWNNFFEQSIGFDKLLSYIDNYYLNVDRQPSYPPYNIIRNSESSYQIVIALAGFSSKDITVSLNENILTVKGNIESDDNADKYRILSSTDGSFYLQNYTSGSWETNIKATGNGVVDLYHENDKKLKTGTD